MADILAPTRSRRGERPVWIVDILIAALCAAGLAAIAAASGFGDLANANGDNDSLMRLVEVRDLLSGQGWFDLHQYRMGPAGGFVMHWSRLVDLPIAVLMLAGSAVSGSTAAGESFAMFVWPTLLTAAALFCILRIARTMAGATALLPAAIIGVATLYFTGQFLPGALDHHNVQIVLMLAVIACMIHARETPSAMGLAGGFCALMLAVGMETAPFVAVAGGVAAVAFLFTGSVERHLAGRFGFSFAVVALAALAVTVTPAAWFAARCDAYSGAQASAAALGGFGLAAIAAFGPAYRTRLRRAVALTVLGGGLVGLALLAFPQCLADPYAGLDPRLKTFWLGAITEAQSFFGILAADPAMLAGYYATPVVAFTVIVFSLRKKPPTRAALIVIAFLATAFAVSVWQVRGAMFSLPLAVIPLAAWVGRKRAQAQHAPSRNATFAMAAAWLLSFNVVWSAAAHSLAPFLPAGLSMSGEPANATPTATDDLNNCNHREDYADLAGLASTTVLAVSNLGAPILAHTPHRVLAGPYHRNADGNLDALNLWMGEPAAARRLLRRRGIALVAFCPGNDESASLAKWAPESLAAALQEGRVPAWLTPIGNSANAALRLYRVD